MRNYFSAFMGFLVPTALIPINEIYAWSNNDKIHILFHKVNELITQGNLYGEGFKKLQELFDDLDETLQKEVVDYIEELYNSGKLGEIIGSAISNSLEGKSGALDLQHIARTIYLAHDYQLPQTENGQLVNIDSTYDIDRYNYVQGGVVFDIDGIRYWANANVCNNGTHFKYNNACYVYVYRFSADETSMTFVTRKAFGNLGHCNGMGYMNGYLYITPNSYQTPDASTKSGYRGVLSTDIHRISFDGNTLGNVETKTIDLGYLNGYIDGVCSNDNTLYFFDGMGDVFSYDWVTNTPTKIYENVKGDNTAYGGMQVSDTFIYFADYENYKIIRFNRNLGTIDWTYFLPIKADCHTYRVGEFENFTIIDGMLYILGCYQIGRAFQCYTIARFFRQNLSKNNLTSKNQVWGWSSPTNTYYQTFFVDGNLINDTDNPSNPTGIHRGSGFSSVQEAIDFIDGSDWVERGIIRVLQTQNATPIEIVTTKPVYITGLEYYTTNNEVPLLGGIVGEFNNVTIENIGIRNIVPTGHGYYDNNCIALTNCNSTLKNIYFPTGLVSNKVSITHGLNVNQGYCSFYNESNFIHTVTVADWESVRKRVGVESPSYINAYACTVNSHRLYSGDTLTANIIA